MTLTPQPMPDVPPPEQICVCGHKREEHEQLEPQCSANGCTCLDFRSRDAVKSSARLLRVSGLAGTAAALAGTTAAAGAMRRKLTNEMSVDRLIREGKQSPRKRTAALAKKLEQLAETLRGYLFEQYEAERERAEAERVRREALDEIAELEAKLATARAKLHPKRNGDQPGPAEPAPVAVADEPVQRVKCPDCDDQVKPAGLGAHRAKKHGYRRRSA